MLNRSDSAAAQVVATKCPQWVQKPDALTRQETEVLTEA